MLAKLLHCKLTFIHPKSSRPGALKRSLLHSLSLKTIMLNFCKVPEEGIVNKTLGTVHILAESRGSEDLGSP